MFLRLPSAPLKHGKLTCCKENCHLHCQKFPDIVFKHNGQMKPTVQTAIGEQKVKVKLSGADSKNLKGSESSANHAGYLSKFGREQEGGFTYSLFGCVLPSVQKWNVSNVFSLCECMTFCVYICCLCLLSLSVYF